MFAKNLIQPLKTNKGIRIWLSLILWLRKVFNELFSKNGAIIFDHCGSASLACKQDT
jgi:hypothetical protein